jgi:very-short-patch-repair endonuclease/predicted transcriptional regulator of viral defense system
VAWLAALIYMGVEEPAFPGKAGWRPQVWRIVQAKDANSGKPGRPAKVFRDLQVRNSGERGLAEIAAAQRTLVHVSQLRALGIGRGSYNHRIAAGSLHRVLPSVVSVVHPVLEQWAGETAALLYAGDNAVLSHESAAAVWGFAATPSFVAITQIGRTPERQPGLRVHRVPSLDIRDVSIHNGFPVTSPARTLIDCAGRGPVDLLLNEARVLKLVTDEAITAAMARCPGRAGIRSLRGLLADQYELGYSRSRAERVLRRLVKDCGLEPPTYNTSVLGYEVDAVWPAQRLVVEVDGHGAHGHQAAFERDRAKDQALVAAGYVVVRFTWNQLTQRPLLVAARVAAALARRG